MGPHLALMDLPSFNQAFVQRPWLLPVAPLCPAVGRRGKGSDGSRGGGDGGDRGGGDGARTAGMQRL